MNTQHTPGPWRDDFEGEPDWGSQTIIQVGAGSTLIADVCVTDDCISDDEHAANARLIAAAPELLEALQCLLAMPDYDGAISTSTVRRGAKHAARAAIAKATGGAA